MRVLLVSFSVLPTLQNYMNLTADSLQKMDLEVYTLGVGEESSELYQTENHYFLPRVDTPKPSVNSINHMRRSMEEIVGIVKKLQPDVLHFVSKHTWNYFIIKKLQAFYKGKILHTVHDPIGHKGDSVRAGVILYNKLIGRNVDGVIVHSKRNVTITMRYLKPKAEIFFAPLGCTKWQPYKKAEYQTGRMLIFGRLNNYKGCKYIPKIAEEIRKLTPDVEIVIAGKASDDVSDKVLKKIASCKNVRFYNSFVPEEKISYYFQNCDLVLVTHTSITQSGILLDAYRYAKPVVCFDIPGIRELLPDVVKPITAFDCSLYAQTAVHLIQNRELCQKIGLEEWQFGKCNFTNKHMSDCFYEIYQKIMQKEQ